MVRSTGIVRRIDDLGRIVIPKEIRRTMRIRETDPLEILIDNSGQIILKKYSHMEDLEEIAKKYVEALASVTGNTVCITDKEKIIAVAGPERKRIGNQEIPEDLIEIIEDRRSFLAKHGDKSFVNLWEDAANNTVKEELVEPIICQGDVLGSLVMLTAKENIMDNDKKLAKTATLFIAGWLED